MKRIILLGLALLTLYSCKTSINIDDLYGKWKYIKDEQPNANPPTVTGSDELKYNDPYIQFTKDNGLMIYWGGKMISHGKFTIDGMNIRYTETLTDGTTRQFPFWVSKLDDKSLVFETTGEDGSRVTAVRE